MKRPLLWVAASDPALSPALLMMHSPVRESLLVDSDQEFVRTSTLLREASILVCFVSVGMNACSVLGSKIGPYNPDITPDTILNASKEHAVFKKFAFICR